MRLVDLAVLYGAAGIGCAAVLYRRAKVRDGSAVLNAATAVLLWPIWAPIAWTSGQRPRSVAFDGADRLDKIREALDEAVQGARGSPLERLFSGELAETIWNEARRVAERNEELLELLRRKEFDLTEATRRLETLEGQAVSPRILASARLHVENVRRLGILAERDARALVEIEALVSALRTELLMVRLSGSSSGAVDDIVGDLWAQIEGLRQATEQGRPSSAAMEFPA